ncbi:MAG: hypothetical protein MR598_04250 [Erysipelotrichaceae bacterium]|nr:hypothetical protein [Erysipelotrichaceae bacterium]
MSVFRINKTNNYTVMSNFHLQDKNLSYKAKGLLSYMLSLPEDWDYSINGLVAVSKEGNKAIRNILTELKENGYLIIEKNQNDKGQYDYEYQIYEIPHTQKGDMDLGDTDNGIQQNTNKQNTKNKDKIDKTINSITMELVKRNFIELTDLDLYLYDDLFNNLLDKYEYKEIVVSTNYTIRKWFENKGLDEENNKIVNKYGYFKTSLENNLLKMTTEVDLGWN